MRNLSLALALLILLLPGCEKESLISEQEFTNSDVEIADAKRAAGTQVQKVSVLPFQSAGDLGGDGNVLTPGDMFPPGSNSFASLKRGKNYLQFNIHTTDLPQGAYTVWWVIFNETTSCTGGGAGGVCGEPDLFLPTTAVVWATSKVVQTNGVGNFSDRIYVGEKRVVNPILGEDLTSPLENPQTAEAHLIIKYHGLASDDPDILYDQLHTLLGSCGPTDGANSLDAGVFGIQCFDPQVAIFPVN
jgi:hypothetical protein